MSDAKPERRWLRELIGFAVAILVVLLLIGAMFLYSNLWPPLVVVESGSMMHSDTESKIGVIDTGDLILVQEENKVEEVRTYVSDYADGHRTFGDCGEVVVYHRNGRTDLTPIIHRAIILLEWNSTSFSYDIPSLEGFPQELWSHDDLQDGRWWSLNGNLELYHVGYYDQTVRVPLGEMIEDIDNHRTGLITKGDHNPDIDQNPSHPVSDGPVPSAWLVGEARMEIPWFGLLKLWVGGQASPWGSETPKNSWTCLFVTIGLLILIPLVFDVADFLLKRRGIDMGKAIKRKLCFWKKEKKPKS